MNPWGWVLIGAGVWVFVAVTFPLVVSLIKRPADEEDARLLIGMSWGWPVFVPLFTVALAVVGIIGGISWVVHKYTELIMGKATPEAEVLEGKVVK